MRRAACAPGLCWPFCWPSAVCWPAGFRRGPASGTCGRQRWCTGDVWCAPHQTARRAGLADPCPCAVLCLEKGGGCVTVLLPLPLLYVMLLLTLACSTHPSLSLTSCFVLSCLAGYRTLNSLLCEYLYQHYTAITAIACHPSGLQRLRRKVSGWRRKRWQGWAQVRAREAVVTRV
jgi:hypothetical protein